MDFFAAFSTLLAAGFLTSAFLRQRIADPAAFQRALFQFLMALVFYYGASMLFMVGAYLSFITMPVGFVLALLSFCGLCRSLLTAPAQRGADYEGRSAEGGAAGAEPWQS